MQNKFYHNTTKIQRIIKMTITTWNFQGDIRTDFFW